MKYRVWVRQEFEGIYEADNSEEAFYMCSDDAMNGGSWDYEVEEIGDDENE